MYRPRRIEIQALGSGVVVVGVEPESIDLEAALEVARRAVSCGAAAALRFFRTGVPVERKPDRSPVTAADRAAEAAILEVLTAAYPDHAILAEESGARGGGPWRWIVDPLDGTKGFIRGLPFWGPIVALEARGEIVVGAVGLPALGETYWAARGLGAWQDGTRLAVSTVGACAEATLSLGELRPLLAPPHGSSVLALVREVANARSFGDVAGPLLVATGRADLWLEAGVKLWDLAAHKIVVEEAGGRFTDFAGIATVASGHAVATNGRLHAEVLARLGT